MSFPPPCWRHLVTPAAPAAWNMACDYVLADRIRHGMSLPVIRFYQWNPYALSFGYGQHLDTEADLDLLRRDGLDYVRRMTGGRAVLHAEELTYSILCPDADPVAAGGIAATYSRTSEAISHGIRAAGVSAILAHATTGLAAQSVGRASQPCFGSVARSEIVVDGRKLVGSAQHRAKGVVLQHGSILIGPMHAQIVRYLLLDDVTRAGYADQLARGTTCLRECGCTLCPEELACVLARSMQSQLNIEWDTDLLTLTDDELKSIDETATEIFASDAWNMRGATGEPSCNLGIKRTGRTRTASEL